MSAAPCGAILLLFFIASVEARAAALRDGGAPDAGARAVEVREADSVDGGGRIVDVRGAGASDEDGRLVHDAGSSTRGGSSAADCVADSPDGGARAVDLHETGSPDGGARVIDLRGDGSPDDRATDTGAASSRAAPSDDPAAAQVEAGAEDELSEQDLADIAAALGADAAAEKSPLAPDPPSGVFAQAAAALQTLDLSLILDVAAGAFTAKSPLQTGAHDPRATGFTLQQLELSIGGAVDPYFRFDANIVFAQFGVEVEEAYATSLALPYRLQARAGQFLTRIGRINATHPHTWAFVDQPLALGRIVGGEGNRGLGVELSWLSPLPWYLDLIGSITDAKGEATARSFFGATDARVLDPLDLQLTGIVEQFFPLHEDWALLIGLSAATGPNPTGYRTRTDVYALDTYVKYRPVTFASTTQLIWQTEIFHRRRQVPNELLQDTSGYSQLLWRFDQRWETGVRHELGTAALGRNGRLAEDSLDPEWTGTRQRTSLVLTFFPTEFSRLRLQTAADFVPWRPRPDFSAFLALEVVAGAHGAHAF